ncbi:MAG TPA: phosphatase PAP2 family protein [Candidatus Dormibacteraeota bacterium]|nr:phosphatase PAP2 family protein [Candidatus Dormibacteraeota bacterium]
MAIAVLAVGFQLLTVAVSLGWMNKSDLDVEQAMASAWDPPLHPLFQGIAILGGVELTSLLLFGLVIYLWRRGFVADAFVFVAFLVAEVFEILYKSNLVHPRPPASVAHADGPSISNLLEPATGLHNSFPSGHMTRTVLIYGLLAFVIRRLAPWPWLRNLAVPAAIVVIVVMAFDRLYLEVHWESDVLGGILLGAIALVSATVWLDRPQRADN